MLRFTLADRVEHMHGLELGGGSHHSGGSTHQRACDCILKAYVLALAVVIEAQRT